MKLVEYSCTSHILHGASSVHASSRCTSWIETPSQTPKVFIPVAGSVPPSDRCPVVDLTNSWAVTLTNCWVVVLVGDCAVTLTNRRVVDVICDCVVPLTNCWAVILVSDCVVPLTNCWALILASDCVNALTIRWAVVLVGRSTPGASCVVPKHLRNRTSQCGHYLVAKGLLNHRRYYVIQE